VIGIDFSKRSLKYAQGKTVRFIMTQLPEPVDEKSDSYKASFKTISDIGKERIRRAAAKIKEEHPEHEGDLGFKVFNLDSSNIRAWNPDRSDLEQIWNKPLLITWNICLKAGAKKMFCMNYY